MHDARHAVILGSSGFLGSRLIRALMNQFDRVFCFSRRAVDFPATSVTSLVGDIEHPPEELLHALEGAVIYHLYSSLKPTPDTTRLFGNLSSDLAPTLRLLEYTKGKPCRWVFASSGGTVYGPSQEEWIDENHPTHPINSYGLIKLTIEHYLALYRHLYGTDYVVARISNPYGPGQSGEQRQGLIAVTLNRISTGRTLEVWGDGRTVRDYVYVDDVAAALVEMGIQELPHRIYNVGSGHGLSINEIIDVISEMTGIRPNIRHTPSRASDVSRNVLSIERIHQDFGWQPVTDFHSGIRQTVDAAKTPKASVY